MSSSPALRILFFEPYPMALGGNFLAQRLILERLDRSRFSAIVVAPVDGIALEHYRRLGIECVVLPPPGRLKEYGQALLRSGILSRLKASIALLQYNMTIARFLREERIDVAYANCVRAEMSVGLAARWVGVPSLLYLKGELANPLIDRLCFVMADRVCFQCRQNRDDRYPAMVRYFRHKFDIIGPGLDPAVIHAVAQRDTRALREELEVDSCRVNVIVLGQLYRPKGQHFVLEALAALVSEYHDLRLYIVGDHVIEEYRSYKRDLDDLIERLGLENHVRFTGWRTDALDVLGVMDMLIHPSLSEGFPIAVLEAMALGKPVIASRVGGIREIIEDGKNGFVVNPGDTKAITQRWRELLMSPGLRDRMGREARNTVFADYLIDDKVARFSDICSELACGKH